MSERVVDVDLVGSHQIFEVCIAGAVVQWGVRNHRTQRELGRVRRTQPMGDRNSMQVYQSLIEELIREKGAPVTLPREILTRALRGQANFLSTSDRMGFADASAAAMKIEEKDWIYILDIEREGIDVQAFNAEGDCWRGADTDTWEML